MVASILLVRSVQRLPVKRLPVERVPVDWPCAKRPEQPCVKRLPVTFCGVAAPVSAYDVKGNRVTKDGTGTNTNRDVTGNRLTHNGTGNRLTQIAAGKLETDHFAEGNTVSALVANLWCVGHWKEAANIDPIYFQLRPRSLPLDLGAPVLFPRAAPTDHDHEDGSTSVGVHQAQPALLA